MTELMSKHVLMLAATSLARTRCRVEAAAELRRGDSLAGQLLPRGSKP